MKHISKLLFSIVVLAMFFAVFVPQVGAQNAADVCQGVAAAGGGCSEASGGTTVNEVIGLVVNILSTLVGIVAVIMIILGGYKYITSSGDSSNIQSAKNTILFAIVGLIIVAMAQVITGFVLEKAS